MHIVYPNYLISGIMETIPTLDQTYLSQDPLNKTLQFARGMFFFVHCHNHYFVSTSLLEFT